MSITTNMYLINANTIAEMHIILPDDVPFIQPIGGAKAVPETLINIPSIVDEQNMAKTTISHTGSVTNKPSMEVINAKDKPLSTNVYNIAPKFLNNCFMIVML